MQKNSDSKNMGKGYIHLYYGYGPGKTTSAIGHTIRAIGHGLKPVWVQFLKKHDPSKKKGYFIGEIPILTQNLGIRIEQFGISNFIRSDEQKKQIKSVIIQGLQLTGELLKDESIDLLVLDEIGSVFQLGLAEIDQFLFLLEYKVSHQEVFITAHESIPKLEKIADYITKFTSERHPIEKGLQARAGVEY